MKLDRFYNIHRSFFDNHLSPEYPLLTKILDCHADLSIQVHPNKTYSDKHNVKGKNEA
jgi:mannose-6-phosphate isomerase